MSGPPRPKGLPARRDQRPVKRVPARSSMKRARPKPRARASEPLAEVCEVRAEGCSGKPNQRHHVVRRSQGGTDERANTLDVCGPCHFEIHANPAWAIEHGYLARSAAPLKAAPRPDDVLEVFEVREIGPAS